MMNSTVKVRMERSVRRIMTLKASAYMLYNIAARRRQAELFNELVRAKLMLEELLFSHKHDLVILPIVLFPRRK
jgi:hypothetical protein